MILVLGFCEPSLLAASFAGLPTALLLAEFLVMAITGIGSENFPAAQAFHRGARKSSTRLLPPDQLVPIQFIPEDFGFDWRQSILYYQTGAEHCMNAIGVIAPYKYEGMWVRKLAYSLLAACGRQSRSLFGWVLLFVYGLIPMAAAACAMLGTGGLTVWLVRHIS